MPENVQKLMSDRLTELMEKTPSLNTLKKLSAKSGVGYGTIRRIRNGDETDPSIGNVQAIAEAFGMSLAEFLSPEPESGSDEAAMLAAFRQLNAERQAFFALHMRREVEITRATQSLPSQTRLSVRQK